MRARKPDAAALFGAAFCVMALNVPVAHADLAAITSQNAEMLTLVDTDSLAIIASLPLPGKPAAVAVDGARDRVLSVATDPAGLYVHDLGGLSRAVWPLPEGAFGIAIHPEDGTALVSFVTGFVARIDPASGQELQRWQVGAMPSGIAVAPGLILVANRDSDTVTLIGKTEQREIPTGHHPFGVTLHDGRAYVTDVLADQVSVIDPDTATVIAQIPTGERPYAVAFAAGKGFVTNQYAASVTVFDARSLEVIATIDTDDYPEGIDASSDGRIFVANWFSDSLQVIDSESLTVTDTIAMPSGPRAFGRFIAVTP